MQTDRTRWGVCRAALLALLLSMGAVSVHADDFGGTSDPGPGSNDDPPNSPCGDCSCDGPDGGNGNNGNDPPISRNGNPISYFNGGESLFNTDVTINGVFPIEISRKYDSASTYDSPLGFGWAFSFDRRLFQYPDNSVVVRFSCGYKDRYVLAGGVYATPPGSMRTKLVGNVDGTFVLTYNNGVKDFFDAQGRMSATQDVRGNRQEFSFDVRGKLPLTGVSKYSVDPTLPLTIAYVYRVTRIDERGADGVLTGHFVTFAYNETTGRLSSVTTNDGRTVSYLQDVANVTATKGNLIQVNGLEGITATYTYADPLDPHNVTAVVDAPGLAAVVNTYDSQDRVTLQTHGTSSTTFNYAIPFTQTIVTRTVRDAAGLNPYNVASTYEFDVGGRMMRMANALGHEQRYQYDVGGNLIREETWNNNAGTLTLLLARNYLADSDGNVTQERVTLDSGEIVTISRTFNQNWVQSEQIVSSLAPSKLFRNEYTFYVNGNGVPIYIKDIKRRRDDGSFQTTTYGLDARQRLNNVTFPDGVEVRLVYTGEFVTRQSFYVSGVEDPNLLQRFNYDAQGNLNKMWDARNNLTDNIFDNLGRLRSSKNPLGEETVVTYSGRQVTQIENGKTLANGEGQITVLGYDDRERQTSVQRKNDAGALETLVTRAFNSDSDVLSVTDAVNRTTSYAYDLLGRVSTQTDAASKITRYFYDGADRLTTVRDALLRDVKIEYDDLDRRTAVVELGVTPNPRTEYSYDAADNVVSVKDAEGRLTSYAFDALSRNTLITQPLGQQTQFVFDNRDRLDYLITARNQKVDYGYETWGPLKEEKQFPTAVSVTPDRTIVYARDADGNVTGVADSGIQAGNSYTTTFDVLSRPFDESVQYLPGGTRTLQHRYDRFGNRSQLNVLDGGTIAHSYTYNKLNRLSAATLAGASISLAYFANDDRQTVTLPNGVGRAYTYKANGPVNTITVTGGAGTIAQFSYNYDDVLNVDTLTDPDGLHDFNHDGLNRLTDAIHPAPSGLPTPEGFTYTAVGNRKTTAAPASWTFDNNHRITASPGLTYTHDADGNLATRSDSLTLTHDARQRLTQIVKSGTTSAYVQDPYGRRIKKTAAGVTTWFLWDGEQLLSEYNAAGVRTKRYAYLEEDYAPTQVEDANGVYYLHADHLDAPRLLTNSASQIVWRGRL